MWVCVSVCECMSTIASAIKQANLGVRESAREQQASSALIFLTLINGGGRHGSSGDGQVLGPHPLVMANEVREANGLELVRRGRNVAADDRLWIPEKDRLHLPKRLRWHRARFQTKQAGFKQRKVQMEFLSPLRQHDGRKTNWNQTHLWFGISVDRKRKIPSSFNCNEQTKRKRKVGKKSSSLQ